MTAKESCPSATQLQGLLSGQAPADQQGALAGHLETCETCRQTLEEMVAGRESWSDAARQLKDEPPAAEPKLRQIMEKIKKEAKEGETQDDVAGAEEISLDFLSPPENPEHLGRLGHYEIVEVIGRGGMGVVLKAFDTALHRIVAIKVLAPQLATTAAARKRFEREGRAAAAIDQEHVVAIYEVEETNGLPYLVMEYVSGVSLQDRLDRSGPLELKEILRIGMQTASGLAAAHAQGLVHRDIKPANILLYNGVERVKITDFGLARAVDDASLTQSGIVAGTPQFMAPEQARGEAVDHRADLFSLGSVLYAMCTGRPPFRASTALAVLKRVSEETPRPLPQINPAIPPWLVEIIEKLHAKDPADRIQSAAEVAELLGQHLAHLQQPGQVPPPFSLRPKETSEFSKSLKVFGKAGARRWMAAAVLLPLIAGGFVVTEATGITNVTEYVGTVLRIRTAEGTLIVQVDDPDVEISIDGDEITIHRAGPQEIRLKPGKYHVQATKHGKEIPLEKDLVTITRGGKQIVKISQEGILKHEQASSHTMGGKRERGPQEAPGSQARKGNQAAARISFRFGEIVQAHFFLKNVGKNPLQVSYPRLISQSYYKALRVIDSEGQEVPVQQADKVPVLVGWLAAPLGVGKYSEIQGPFLSIGNDGEEDTGVETLLKVRPGRTYRVQYTLPNYGDPKADNLQTGEFTFRVLEKSAPTINQLLAEQDVAWGKPGQNGLQIGVLLAPYQPPSIGKIEQSERSGGHEAKDLKSLKTKGERVNRELLQQRYVTLKQIAEETRSRFQAGGASEDDLVQARLPVLKTALELAESDEEQVKVQEQIVAQLKRLEEIQEQRFQAGRILQKDVLKARADRLQAEKELQELRQKSPEAAKPKEDLEKLQGDWVAIRIERAGKSPFAEAAEQDKEPKLVVRGKKLTFFPFFPNQLEASFELDSTQTPPRMAYTLLNGSNKGKTTHAIYHLDGDTLILCYYKVAGSPYPDDFETQSNENLKLMVFKRVLSVKLKRNTGEEAVQAARAELQNIRNLQNIGWAIREFQTAYGHRPPTSLYSGQKPLWSWRVIILPFLGEEKLYKEFQLEEAWDSEHNKELLAKMPKVFASPAGGSQKEGWTSYRALAGMVVEAGEPVAWTQPEELDFRPGKPLPKLGGLFPDRFHVLMADGSVYAIKKNLDERQMRLLLRRNERKFVDIDELKP